MINCEHLFLGRQNLNLEQNNFHCSSHNLKIQNLISSFVRYQSRITNCQSHNIHWEQALSKNQALPILALVKKVLLPILVTRLFFLNQSWYQTRIVVVVFELVLRILVICIGVTSVILAPSQNKSPPVNIDFSQSWHFCDLKGTKIGALWPELVTRLFSPELVLSELGFYSRLVLSGCYV